MTVVMQPTAIDMRSVPQFSVTDVKNYVDAIDRVIAMNPLATVPYYTNMDDKSRKLVALLFTEEGIVPYPHANSIGGALDERSWRQSWWEYPEMTWTLVSKALREKYVNVGVVHSTDVQAFSSLDTLRGELIPVPFDIPIDTNSLDNVRVALDDYEEKYHVGISTLSPLDGTRITHERLYLRLISFLGSKALPLQANGLRNKEQATTSYTQAFAKSWAERMEDKIPHFNEWKVFRTTAFEDLKDLSRAFAQMMHLTPEAQALGFHPTAAASTASIPPATFAQSLRVALLPHQTQSPCSVCGGTLGSHSPCPHMQHPYANHEGGAYLTSTMGRQMAQNAVLMTRLDHGNRVLTRNKQTGDYVPMCYIHKEPPSTCITAPSPTGPSYSTSGPQPRGL